MGEEGRIPFRGRLREFPDSISKIAKNLCCPYSTDPGGQSPDPQPGRRKEAYPRRGINLPDVQASLNVPTRLGIYLRPRYERFRATRQRVVPACVRSGNRRTNNQLAVLAFPRREQQGADNHSLFVAHVDGVALLLLQQW